MDYPEAYDFEEHDVDEAEGPIWYVFTLCSNHEQKLMAP
jgi:hypothetical protein